MISTLKAKNIPAIVNLHINSLPGDFLPQLGPKFLEIIYKSALDKYIFGFVSIKSKKIQGFVIGTTDMDLFFKRTILNNLFKLSFHLLIIVIQKPKLLKNILETIFYPKKESGPKAELIIIIVNDEFKRQGIGRLLVKKISDKFRSLNIPQFKLTVHADKRAIKFYENLNFIRTDRFYLYGKNWYVYIRKTDS